MIVALSVYSGDAAAAQRLLEWIAELGGVNSHNLLLVVTPQVNSSALIETAKRSWANVELQTLNFQDDRIGWPVGPNRTFQFVCNHLKDRGQPFFFLESDCVPIVGNWLDQLEREYHANAKPFMGVVHSTVNPYTGEVVPNSLHMNGAGIYPAQVDRYLPSLPFLMTAMADQPWDMALRHEMMSLTNGRGGFTVDDTNNRVSACHATGKICFSWRTKNYRVEDDQIKYDADGPRTHLKPLDFWKHVLHHGCKDGSLIDVLRQRLNPKPKLVTKIVETPTLTQEVLDQIKEGLNKGESPSHEGPYMIAFAGDVPPEFKPYADEHGVCTVPKAKPAMRKVAKIKGRRGRPPKNIVVDSVSK